MLDKARFEGRKHNDCGEASARFQDAELPTEFRYKSGISGKQPLRCERVNEMTFKITDGEMTRVPAQKGWWVGYNTTRTCASLINVGISSAVWLARCEDRVCGPLPFNEAKAAAINLAKGADGDYRTSNPIAHLNGLQARLLELGGA